MFDSKKLLREPLVHFLLIGAVLFLPRHEPLSVSETRESLYTSIDLAAKELERQVRRYREKMQGKQRAR